MEEQVFNIGKMLVFCGVFMVIFGLFFILAGKIPFFGKLPGDIAIHTNVSIFIFP
jgi:uncharacterized membrane protein